MKTRCLHSYCLFAVAAAAATYCGVEGLSWQGHSVDHHHHHHHQQQQQQQQSQPSPQTPQAPPPSITASRRDVFQSTKSAVLGAFCGWILAPKFSLAAVEESSSLSLVTGRITVPSDYTATNSNTNALYITCRPDRPDSVPQAILDGSRGKAPPVLTARYQSPSFPFEFALTENDVTEEGKSSTSTRSWWQNDKLVVSARLDTDGIAATRSPEDLVGRGFFLPGSSSSVVEIALGGRGAFGKFATKQ